MGTSLYDFEGTAGSLPGAMSSGFGTMTLATSPNGTSATDFQVSTVGAAHGSKSGQITSVATGGFYWTTTFASTTYLRGYFNLPNAPTNSFSLGYLYGSGFAANTFWGVTTDQRLYVVRNGGGTAPTGANYWQSDPSLVPLVWCRFEVELTATSVHMKLWTASGAGIDSTGTPDVDSGVLSGSTLGTIDQVAIGAFSSASGVGRTFVNTNGLLLDDFAISDAGWIGPASSTVTGDAAATLTATGTTAAAASRLAAAASTITLTTAAAAGKTTAGAAAPSITATAAADAAIITTHSAEATAQLTVTANAEATRILAAHAAGTATAASVATAATDTSANGQLLAIGEARIVIEGQTSPGFLYGAVKKNVLTS